MLLIAEYILPITDEPIEDGAVLVRDGRIADIGTAANLRLRYPDEETRDFGTAAVMPGFVDLHTRLENNVMRGMVRDAPYAQWLVDAGRKGVKMSTSDWTYSAILGGMEALAAGITCVADIAPNDASLTAVQDLGLRGTIYREVGATDKQRVPYVIEAARNDIEDWRSRVDTSRVSVGIAPAPLYACHPTIFEHISTIAADGTPVAMHLAGSREEYNFIKYGSSTFSVARMEEGLGDNERGYVEMPPWLPTGATPVNYALNWGAFNCPNVLAIHCVHVDDEDIEKLREYDVAIAVCPRYNAQLAMGVAPIAEFFKNGLRMGLGTGSPAAVTSTDMLIEMRNGMLIQRALNPGQFMSAEAALRMATIDGARALRLDDRIGSLQIGKCADIVAVDLSESHQTPTDDPVSAVVNTTNAADVLMTMVGGTILFEKNRWHVDVDVAKSIANVLKIRRNLRA